MSHSQVSKIYTVSNPTQAEMIKNLLRDHDVCCEIDGELQAGFTGTFEIGILVPTVDAKRALDILKLHHVDS